MPLATEFSCPACGARYLVKEEVPEGRRLRCKKCGETFSPNVLADTRVSERPTGSGNGIDLAGRKIGGCRIEKMLGKGGMGVVYRARHLALDIAVAVKILPPQFIDGESSFTDRFIREARAAARLQHQNIVGVLNVGRQGGLHYIIMQFVDGESLEDRIRREGRLGPAACLDIMIQLCEALKVAYRHKIVHRDIKPDNILIDTDGVVKLADLGLAKNIEDGAGLTQSGIGMGTPHYMAPEQAADVKTADHRSDIYSLGCTFFRMLAGRPPFEGESGFTILTKHTSQPVPDLRDVAPDLPAALVAVVNRMMAKEPDDRYQTPDELAAGLEEARRAITTGASVAPSIASSMTPQEDAARVRAVPPPEPVISEADAEVGIMLAAPPSQTGTMAGRDRYIWGLGAMIVLVLAIVVAWAISAVNEPPPEQDEATPAASGQHVTSPKSDTPEPAPAPAPARAPEKETQPLSESRLAHEQPDPSQPSRDSQRSQDAQPGDEPPQRQSSASDNAKGSIRLSDWTLYVGGPDEPFKGADLATTEHSLKGGVLRLRNTTGKPRAAICYSARRLTGDFRVALEVRGAFMFGISRLSDAGDQKKGLVIRGPDGAGGLRPPPRRDGGPPIRKPDRTGRRRRTPSKGSGLPISTPDKNDDRRQPPSWRKVVLQRENGVLECTIGGIKVPEDPLRGDRMADGFLWIRISAAHPTEIRSCTVRSN